ncbi:MAG: hypothetical protein KME05_05185 [Gloeocapsa sp. UFS-A4-WI-NPMV-4B04]|jgi:hypothetical protein|nr:hypothetical protein [Gloeocapsa sp. UFS-A4-WI-NPMV-4B04]
MQKFVEKWNALSVHKQVASILVFFLLSYSLYSSIVTVLVMPTINHLQQESRHDS